MPATPLTAGRLAAMIDHTFLKASGTAQDIETLCAEAREYAFATVMVNPAEIEKCLSLLAGSPVKTGVTIAFPLGQCTSRVKDYETRDALQRGAQEIDMVLNLRALIAGDTALVENELQTLAKTCAEAKATSKIILETCYLNDAQKRLACTIARDAGVGYVKTSTGFGSGGATAADVRLLRETVGDALGVKASGGIRDLAAALAMIEAGATRLGTSGSVAIVSELAN